MKVLITGHKGFIGNYLSAALKGINLPFCGYDLKDGNDILDKNKFIDFAKENKPEIVIHLAAQSLLRKSINDPIADLKTNILGSVTILEACKELGIKRFLYTSTGGARYGDKNKILNESDNPEPISPYGISKHTVEHYLKYYKKNFGINYLCLYLGNVIGGNDPIENERILITIINKIYYNKLITVYGDGKQRRDFVFINDVINIFLHIIRSDFFVSQAYNLSSSVSLSIVDLISLVEKMLNKKASVRFVSKVTGEVRDNLLDCSKAKTDLKWAPLNIIQAIACTLSEFVEREEEKNAKNINDLL